MTKTTIPAIKASDGSPWASCVYHLYDKAPPPMENSSLVEKEKNRVLGQFISICLTKTTCRTVYVSIDVSWV